MWVPKIKGSPNETAVQGRIAQHRNAEFAPKLHLNVVRGKHMGLQLQVSYLESKTKVGVAEFAPRLGLNSLGETTGFSVSRCWYLGEDT